MIYIEYIIGCGCDTMMNETRKKQIDIEQMDFELQTKELASCIVKSLVEERKSQGITQQNIADRTGMKTANVTRIESCKNTPTLEILIRYANALGKKLNIRLEDIT